MDVRFSVKATYIVVWFPSRLYGSLVPYNVICMVGSLQGYMDHWFPIMLYAWLVPFKAIWIIGSLCYMHGWFPVRLYGSLVPYVICMVGSL